MKIKNLKTIFFERAAWSWLVFGIVSVVLEIWRPGFVDYLIPVWVIFSVAALAALITKI